MRLMQPLTPLVCNCVQSSISLLDLCDFNNLIKLHSNQIESEKNMGLKLISLDHESDEQADSEEEDGEQVSNEEEDEDTFEDD